MNILPSFTQPWILLLLSVVPAALVVAAARSGVDGLFQRRPGRGIAGRTQQLGTAWRLALRLLGLTCVVIALAGPALA